MTRRTPLATAVALALALPVFAGDGLTISDAYARSSGGFAGSGAAFMLISNAGPEADRLIAVRSEAAERVELHTHLIDANGVARMVEVEDGFAIPAGSSHKLQRGGDHIMFLGLAAPFEQGETIALTLVFERAGEIALEIPVDLARRPMRSHGAMPGSGG